MVLFTALICDHQLLLILHGLIEVSLRVSRAHGQLEALSAIKLHLILQVGQLVFHACS